MPRTRAKDVLSVFVAEPYTRVFLRADFPCLILRGDALGSCAAASAKMLSVG